jgi:sugar lactone lactonase YvrE
MIRITYFLLLISLSFSTRGQLLHKYDTHMLNGPDGITVDSAGNIYIANWGQDGKGSTVVKISPDGSEKILADNLASPDGLTFDRDGNLYVSCFSSGDIIKISSSGQRELYAHLPDHPSDLKFDRFGNLFVSGFGNFDGTKIYKIDKHGSVTVFAEGFAAPLGLAFDNGGLLYVSNFASGVIHKVDAKGLKEVFVQLPQLAKSFAQYLSFDNKGNLYCASFGQNCIYKIDSDGSFMPINFPVNLQGPNSVLIYKGVLYFTEFTSNSFSRLLLEDH